METCKTYKGFDLSCKIQGLYSKYFYIVFVSALACAACFLMSFNSFISSWDWVSFLVEILLEVGSLVVVYIIFYRRSNMPKLKLDSTEVTISNRYLYKVLK